MMGCTPDPGAGETETGKSTARGTASLAKPTRGGNSPVRRERYYSAEER